MERLPPEPARDCACRSTGLGVASDVQIYLPFVLTSCLTIREIVTGTEFVWTKIVRSKFSEFVQISDRR